MKLKCTYLACKSEADVIVSGYSLCTGHRDQVLTVMAHYLQSLTADDIKPFHDAVLQVDHIIQPGPPSVELPEDFDPNELLEGNRDDD